MGKAKKLLISGSAPNQTTLSSYFNRQPPNSRPSKNLFTLVVDQRAGVAPLRDSINRSAACAAQAAGDARLHARGRPTSADDCSSAAVSTASLVGAGLGGALRPPPCTATGERVDAEQPVASELAADLRNAAAFVCDSDDEATEVVAATPEQPRKKSFARSFLGSGQAARAARAAAAASPAAAKTPHTTRPHTAPQQRSGGSLGTVGSVGSLPRSVFGGSHRDAGSHCGDGAAGQQRPDDAGHLSSSENVEPSAVHSLALGFGVHVGSGGSGFSTTAAVAAALSKRAAEKGCSPRAKKMGGRDVADGETDVPGLAGGGGGSSFALHPADRGRVKRALLKLAPPAASGSRRSLSAEMSDAVKGHVTPVVGADDDVHLNDVMRELGGASAPEVDSRQKRSVAALGVTAAASASADRCCGGSMLDSIGSGRGGCATAAPVLVPAHGSCPADDEVDDDDEFLHTLIADLHASSFDKHESRRSSSGDFPAADVFRQGAACDLDGAPNRVLEAAVTQVPGGAQCRATAAAAAATGSAAGRSSPDSATSQGHAVHFSRADHQVLATVSSQQDGVARHVPMTTDDDGDDSAALRLLGQTALSGRAEPGRDVHDVGARVPPDSLLLLRQSAAPGRRTSAASIGAACTAAAEPPSAATGPIARCVIDYGRHVVRDRQESGSGDVVLLLVGSGGGADLEAHSMKRCILRGTWSDTLVQPGDTVNVVGSFDRDTATCVIDDRNNFIVVHPDRLMSGTSVVSAVGCLRRAVLSEQCKGLEAKNASMLLGSIIHAVFQEVLRSKLHRRDQITSIAEQIVRNPDFLHDMLLCGVTEQKVLQEMEEYIPNIEQWFKRHMLDQLPPARDSVHALVQRVMDIEENVWCPRFGLKGKIDVTLDVKIRPRRSGSDPRGGVGKSEHSSASFATQGVLPLELKTGKATFSSEHKGQVVLYTMMLSDRRNEDVSSGLLLYLKHDTMKEVKATHAERRGLIQLRNQLSYYASARARKDGSGEHRLPSLAQGINVESWCSRCPQALNCTLYQRVAEPEAALSPDHPVAGVFQRATEHLSSAHIEYFAHWLLLLRLEADSAADSSMHQRRDAMGTSRLSDLWCTSSADREKAGSCIGSMRLEDVTAAAGSNGCHTHRFARATDGTSAAVLQLSSASGGGLQQGDSVVVSREDGRHVGLAQGLLTERSSVHVLLQLDRDLRNYDECYTCEYRIDRLEYSSDPMTTNYCNLSSLMSNEPASQKLRELIVDGRRPLFEPTLSKSQLHTIKPIVSGLNKAQKGAILKALMCKDYILVSGYPGTGKTSTIAALVRSLAALNRTVLIVSYTNSAVDTILLKLAHHGVDFVRCGRKSRMHADLHQYSLESLASGAATVAALKRLYESKRVVAATCHSVAQADGFLKRFDVCIVDEASQTLQPSCIGALLRAERFVFVGDDMQLPPIVTSPDARRLGMEESMFTRFRKSEGALFELTEQYRMNSEIMRLANELVYNNRLSCGSDAVADATLQLRSELTQKMATAAPWLESVLSGTLSRSVVFLDVPAPERVAEDSERNSHGIENAAEAHVVQRVVVALAQCGMHGHEIGVVTPFRAQVRLIQRMLLDGSCSAALAGDGSAAELRAVEVSTVDQYQGRDKSAIVMSFVKGHVRRADDENEGKGILDDIRRLNVALTRSRHKLVLVGSSRALTSYRPLRLLLAALRPEQLVTVTSDPPAAS